MAEKRFNVVFSGKLVEGKSHQEVLTKLCSVLGQEQQQVREIFKGGFGAIIHKELDGSKAYAMREELREAGAICTVNEILPPKATEAAPRDMQTMEAPLQAHFARKPSHESRPLQSPPAVAAKNGSGVGALIFKIVLIGALASGGWWGYQTYFTPP